MCEFEAHQNYASVCPMTEPFVLGEIRLWTISYFNLFKIAVPKSHAPQLPKSTRIEVISYADEHFERSIVQPSAISLCLSWLGHLFCSKCSLPSGKRLVGIIYIYGLLIYQILCLIINSKLMNFIGAQLCFVFPVYVFLVKKTTKSPWRCSEFHRLHLLVGLALLVACFYWFAFFLSFYQATLGLLPYVIPVSTFRGVGDPRNHYAGVSWSFHIANLIFTIPMYLYSALSMILDSIVYGLVIAFTFGAIFVHFYESLTTKCIARKLHYMIHSLGSLSTVLAFLSLIYIVVTDRYTDMEFFGWMFVVTESFCLIHAAFMFRLVIGKHISGHWLSNYENNLPNVICFRGMVQQSVLTLLFFPCYVLYVCKSVVAVTFKWFFYFNPYNFTPNYNYLGAGVLDCFLPIVLCSLVIALLVLLGWGTVKCFKKLSASFRDYVHSLQDANVISASTSKGKQKGKFKLQPLSVSSSSLLL